MHILHSSIYFNSNIVVFIYPNILNSYAPPIWTRPYVYLSILKYEVKLTNIMLKNDLLFCT